MEEKLKLAEEINTAKSLQLLATAYEEISVMKMRIARDSVLHTRIFLSSLTDVFVNVKSSYTKKLLEQSKDKNPTGLLKFATHKKNGKQVFVFLSAANKLYGDIVLKTFELFKQRLQVEQDADVVVVGKTGKELYDPVFADKQYAYFDIPDVIPSVEVLKPIIATLVEYEHVTVFYGRFVNVVKQEPIASSISGDAPLEKSLQQQDTKPQDFLFEPSIDELWNFFETQIFSSLFKQTIAEEELARLASRIKTMEQAIVFINLRIGNLSNAERRAKRQIENRKQLERIAGISLWGK